MNTSAGNIFFQKVIVATAFILFLVKIAAWYITGSVAVLTDALESTVNITASLISLYSLYIASRPKDVNHPYGHGKAEFLAAAFEGILIIAAGIFIIYKAVSQYRFPQPVVKLDTGLLLISASAIVNYVIGTLAVARGKKVQSHALIASGKHLQTDTYSTAGIIAGLAVMLYTENYRLDSIIALIFAGITIYTGIKIMRSSLAGIMDEADEKLLGEVVAYLNSHRKPNWIDMHNLRIIKYGSVLHLDCHLTVPWFLNVRQAHDEVDDLAKMIRDKYGDAVELFVHTDGCLDFSCRICSKQDCTVRQHAFKERLDWNVQNISSDKKHSIQ